MSKLQSRILKRLDKLGYYAINITSASKNGVPDIVGCLPTGRFFAIEVKEGGDVLDDLQRHNLTKILLNNGVTLTVRSVKEFDMWVENNFICA